MNYAQFYKDAENNLIESMTSLWVPGHPKEIAYLRNLFEKREPIMSEPEFQTIFPWETSASTFEEHFSKLEIFDREFVNSISQIKEEKYKEYEFPLSRYPYKHQTASWRAMLKEKKTIVVTTGTGSGKTECFMLPVLQDLYRQRLNGVTEGIQAIFLYPLNALMKNQQNRIHAWCKSLNPYVTYAIYNGETEEKRLRQSVAKDRLPQICSREEIRDTPPQILFTNPTMLNYMLVRSEDQHMISSETIEFQESLFAKSRGKLRWIILDEAHTYTGSSAAELALQIRQVIDAFGVSMDDVNFALTSATIGDADDENAINQMKDNISKLTGKQVRDIAIIDGKRIIPDLDESRVKTELDAINSQYETEISLDQLVSLRRQLNAHPCLSLSKITERFHKGWSRLEALRFVDALGEKRISIGADGSTQALLPTRAHFFIRSIHGIYACVNPECPGTKFGHTEVGVLTSYQRMECPYCHQPLLEVATCSDCGGLVVQGEYDTHDGFRQKTKTQELETLLFDEPDDESEDECSFDIRGDHGKHYQSFVFGKDKRALPRASAKSYNVHIDFKTHRIEREDTTSVDQEGLREVYDNNTGSSLCPHCAANIGGKTQYFRASAEFMSRSIAPLLLDNADSISTITPDTLYEGRKFIAFTDSRQGTAKAAFAQNLEVERRWIRGAVFHELADRRRDLIQPSGLSVEEQDLLEELKSFKSMRGGTLPPRMQAQLDSLIQRETGDTQIPPALPCYWDSLEAKLIEDKDLKRLARHMSDARIMNVTGNKSVAPYILRDYLQALFIDQFCWIPKRSNSLETLGLIHLVYPPIDKAKVPAILAREGFDDVDWRKYLKICIDYFIRANKCVSMPASIKDYLAQSFFAREVYGREANVDKALKWPCLEEEASKVNEKQCRIVLVLCAALGITDASKITQVQKDAVNEGLKQAWLFIRDNVLTETDHTNNGYRLDLLNSKKVAVQLMTEGWLCPINRVVIDTNLKGYSPRMTGFINDVNFERFRIGNDSLELPYYPYAFRKKRNPEGNVVQISDEDIRTWITGNWNSLIECGVYKNLHFGVLKHMPIYMAGEHSAQQQRVVLDKYETDFNEGRLNILSCSTTMEMGVDLKGISEVVMNTVPPKPANYLQRAGRAGRRGESKAMAVTFCAPTPVAMNAWNNPSWPMKDKTKMPQIKLESMQIVQRHVNSVIFAKHISGLGGMRITTSTGDFFGTETMAAENFRNYLDHLAYDSDIDEGIQSSYKALVKGTVMAGIPFQTAVQKTIKALVFIQNVFKNRLDVLKDNLSSTDENSRAWKAITKKIENYNSQNILSFMAENNFLPSAGMPTGLVNFIPKNDDTKSKLDKLPTQHISQAISNYAPGRQVIINEWCYESEGIAFKTKYDESKRNILQRCNQCGYTTIVYGSALHQCPKCQSIGCMHGVKDMKIGVDDHFTEIVEPAAFGVRFGYEPRRVIKPKTSLDMIQPVLLNMEPWGTREVNSLYSIRCSNPESEILVYNKGGKGLGFAYCPICGAMKQEQHRAGEAGDDRPLSLHQHFETGGACDGSGADGAHIHRNVLLVGHYQTDFVEIKFYDENNNEIKDEEILYSLGVIISRKLTEILGVNDGEIDFGYYSGYHSIFIYDTAIGGAGYSILLRDYKDIVLDECLKSLEACNCNSSCTNCLIDRRSQWYINYLNRQKALTWLRLEHETRCANKEFRTMFADASVVTSDFNTEFYAVTRNEHLKSLHLFIDSDASSWKPDLFPHNRRLQDLKSNGVSVNLVMRSKPNVSLLSAEQQSSLMSVLYNNYVQTASWNLDGLKPLMLVEDLLGRKTAYMGKDLSTAFDDTWGQGKIFMTREHFDLEDVKDLDANEMLTSISTDNDNIMLEETVQFRTIAANGLFKDLLKAEVDKWSQIKDQLSGKSFDVKYSDRYLVKPFDIYILVHFIESVRYEMKIKIKSVTIEFDRNLNEYSTEDYESMRLMSRFVNKQNREAFTKFCFEEYMGISPLMKNTNVEHARPMSFKSEDLEFVIRPDAGISHNYCVNKPNRYSPDLTISDLQEDPDLNIDIYSLDWDNFTHSFKTEGNLFTISLKKKKS